MRELERQQREADEEAARLKPAERKKAAARQKTHQRLRIIGGSAAGGLLLACFAECLASSFLWR